MKKMHSFTREKRNARIRRCGLFLLGTLFFSLTEPLSASAESIQKIRLQKKTFPFENALLRDPFWGVGSFPPEWGKKEPTEEERLSTSEWRVPATRLQVNGVSRMGNRVMALINGNLYSTGDVVEVAYQGKIFQWKVASIQPDGNVQFERHKIITETP